MRFRKNPIEFEAVQFTGYNFKEVREFTGARLMLHDEWVPIFNPIGTYLLKAEDGAVAELWVEANKRWLGIEIGEWIVQDQLGFYPCKDEIMQKNNTPIDAECTCPPEEQPTFAQELVQLLNKHNMERYSGTPDWILGNFLEMVLRQFDCAVTVRANWRGESTELPALQRLFDTNDRTVIGEPRFLAEPLDALSGSKSMIEVGDHIQAGVVEGLDGKTVPLVQYVDGRRNEIGEAKIKVTPGEILFAGSLANIESVVPLLGFSIPEGQFSIADTDPLNKGDR